MKPSSKNLAGALVLGWAAFAGSAWACGGAFCFKMKEAGMPASSEPAMAGNAEIERYASAEKSESGKKAKEERIVLKVEGMTCGSCEFHVKRALKKVPGVKEAKASTKAGNAEALYDPAQAKPEDLVNAINKIGYKASLPIPSGAQDSAAGG